MAPPALSVIVPFVNEESDLAGVLHALDANRASVSLDVIVPCRGSSGLPRLSDVGTSSVRWLQLPEGTPIPQMRAAAIRVADAPAVAIIEDHVRVPPQWARAMLDALTPDSPVVAGSVVNGATGTTVDWAAFLCEYSHAMPPLPSGRVAWLTGNNVTYRRDVLLRHLHIFDAGGWENELHQAILDEGLPLTCHPEIEVVHQKHYSLTEYLGQRYLYSRSFAARRTTRASISKRVTLALASALLPVILFTRILRRVSKGKRHRQELLRSLPLLMLFVVAWAAGEFVGYAAGAGNSLSRVR